MRIAIYGLATIALAACAALAEKQGHEVVKHDELPTPETAEPADLVVCELGASSVAVDAAYAGTETPIYGQSLDQDWQLVQASGGWVAFAEAIGVPVAPVPAEPSA